MKIVIDIPEEAYNTLLTEQCIPTGLDLEYLVMHGTPLPEGHGRLGDLDSIMKDINDSINELTNIGISVDGDYLWAKLNDAVDNASVIIEADKESEE